jgi:hypothetical protein
MEHVYDTDKGMKGNVVYSEMQFDDLACASRKIVKRSFNVVSVILGCPIVYGSLKYQMVIGSDSFRDVDTIILLVILEDDKPCEFIDGAEQESIVNSDRYHQIIDLRFIVTNCIQMVESSHLGRC